MAFVETEIHDQIMVIRLNRPERLNAIGTDIRRGMADAFTEFHNSDRLEIAILTGTGRGFCAGEDMKESVERGTPGSPKQQFPNPFNDGTLQKPVIAAVNGFAMGGGFMLVERTDLRVAVKGAVFEVSEAKRWLLGGFNHGYVANLPHAIATEMALGFRFTAGRLYEVGFLNRLVDEQDDLIPTAIEMAEHMLILPPAARVNTIYMMRQMIPRVPPQLDDLATALKEHGSKDDLMESRHAFAEKRKPNFKGWDNAEDRYNLPTLESTE